MKTDKKCYSVGHKFGRIESGFQDVAEAIFFGRRKAAISQITNVLSDVRQANRSMPSKLLGVLDVKARTYRKELSAAVGIQAVPKELLRKLKPIVGLAKKAAREARKKYCG